MNLNQWTQFHFTHFEAQNTQFIFMILNCWNQQFFLIDLSVFLSSNSFSFRFIRYNIVFLVLTYGIPMLIMVVCYSVMGRVLWGSKSIGEHTQRQIESIKSKKKVCASFSKIDFIRRKKKKQKEQIDSSLSVHSAYRSMFILHSDFMNPWDSLNSLKIICAVCWVQCVLISWLANLNY